MAYNQMLQSTIAATNEEAQQYKESVLTFVDSPAEIQVVQGYQYFKILDGTTVEYVMLIRGDSDDIYTIGKLVAFQTSH